MIFEESCDTENRSNGYILKTVILNCNNISQYYCFCWFFFSNKCSYGAHKRLHSTAFKVLIIPHIWPVVYIKLTFWKLLTIGKCVQCRFSLKSVFVLSFDILLQCIGVQTFFCVAEVSKCLLAAVCCSCINGAEVCWPFAQRANLWETSAAASCCSGVSFLESDLEARG